MMSDSRILDLSKLSIAPFVSVFLVIIFANCFIYNLSLHSVIHYTKRSPQGGHITLGIPQNLRKISSNEVLLSVINEVEEKPKKSTQVNKGKKLEVLDRSHLLPPFHVSDRERIGHFKRNQPHFIILKSTRSSKQFDGRIRDFFGNNQCQIKFYMTWISPASAFSKREFLALESLFKSNPNGCLVILSKTMDSAPGHKILKPLQDFGFRVTAMTPDLSFLFEETPAESWFGEIMKGKMDPQNLSNLIRLAILYKYGGVYLDTDFIVLKDFSGLKNSIGAQSVDAFGNWTRLNNAVLVFDKSHALLRRFMEEFTSTFDGNKWGHNGPYLVSRVLATKLKRKKYNFTIMSPMAFYPVDWTKIASLFAKPVNRADSKWVEAKLIQLSGESYGVHLWNKKSKRLKIKQGSIIGRLISNNCVICKNIYSS